jgi:hypothetical protein
MNKVQKVWLFSERLVSGAAAVIKQLTASTGFYYFLIKSQRPFILASF